MVKLGAPSRRVRATKAAACPSVTTERQPMAWRPGERSRRSRLRAKVLNSCRSIEFEASHRERAAWSALS